MMSIPLPQKRSFFRRAAGATPAQAAPRYIAPAPRTTDDDAEALRRILREHAARWR